MLSMHVEDRPLNTVDVISLRVIARAGKISMEFPWL